MLECTATEFCLPQCGQVAKRLPDELSKSKLWLQNEHLIEVDMMESLFPGVDRWADSYDLSPQKEARTPTRVSSEVLAYLL